MTPATSGRRISRWVFEEGFESVIRRTVAEISGRIDGGLDTFSLSRAEDLALAARVFDATGSRDIEEFLAYARSYTMRDPDTDSAVQVMTIHKSKGLTFDMVILPDLEGYSLTDVRRTIGVMRNRNREVEWVYDLPTKEIADADSRLSAYRKDREADAAYESLCKYYVAMTRAKYANYLITNPRSSKSQSKNFIMMLEIALAEDRHEGRIGRLPVDILYRSHLPTSDPKWYLGYQRDEPQEEAKPRPVEVSVPETRERVDRRTPSRSERQVITARLLFSRDGQKAREFGTLVHALFEDVEWIEDFDPVRARERWLGLPGWSGDVLREAVDHTLSCLGSEPVRGTLSRPGQHAECWREKKFEILLNREWLSGTFDRVSIERDAAGHAVRAAVLDFKTDQVRDEADRIAAIEKYRPQLELYRDVLQRMTGLAADRIEKRLLLTRTATVISL